MATEEEDRAAAARAAVAMEQADQAREEVATVAAEMAQARWVAAAEVAAEAMAAADWVEASVAVVEAGAVVASAAAWPVVRLAAEEEWLGATVPDAPAVESRAERAEGPAGQVAMRELGSVTKESEACPAELAAPAVVPVAVAPQEHGSRRMRSCRCPKHHYCRPRALRLCRSHPHAASHTPMSRMALRTRSGT